MYRLLLQNNGVKKRIRHDYTLCSRKHVKISRSAGAFPPIIAPQNQHIGCSNVQKRTVISTPFDLVYNKFNIPKSSEFISKPFCSKISNLTNGSVRSFHYSNLRESVAGNKDGPIVDKGDGKMLNPSSDSSGGSKQSASAITMIKNVYIGTVDMIRNPAQTWQMIKETVDHYWVGSKLLWVEIKMAVQILNRLFQGHGMTRRERMQLIRTTMDLFRLVPFSIFIIVPFMELLLPVALKLFPNMLPSTFQDDFKKEEGMKRDLQMRLAVAGFMQETLQEMAKAKKRSKESEATGGDTSGAKEVVDFIEKARLGEPLSNESVIRIARLFKDELTLANIARPQLVSMCRYMSLQPYGADAFLRFQLRTKLRSIKEDDRRILWEGADSLTTLELREACQERGMRSVGLTSFGYKRQLKEWLDLSIQKNIPISLLIMSRAFALSSTSAHPEDVLKSSMSSLDSDTINEVVLAVALPAEENTIDMKNRKLESIQFQKEMIEEEREEKQDAIAEGKSRKGKEKEKAEGLFAVAMASKSAPTLDNVVTSAAVLDSPAVSAAPSAHVEDGASIKAIKGSTPVLSMESVTSTGTPTKGPEAVAVVIMMEEKKEAPHLTVREVQALGDLTRGSSVEREKAELAILEASVDAVAMNDGEGEGEGEGDVDSARSPVSVVASVTETLKQAAAQTINMASASSQVSSGTTDKVAITSASTEEVSSGQVKKAAEKAPKKEDREDKSILRMKSALNDMLDKLKVRIDTTEKALGDKFRLLDQDNDGELSSEELKDAISKLLKRTPTNAEAEDIVQLLDRDKDGKVSVMELLQYVEERREKYEVEELEAQMLHSASNASEELGKISLAKKDGK